MDITIEGGWGGKLMLLYLYESRHDKIQYTFEFLPF
jgi:hypothetical protein